MLVCGRSKKCVQYKHDQIKQQDYNDISDHRKTTECRIWNPQNQRTKSRTLHTLTVAATANRKEGVLLKLWYNI